MPNLLLSISIYIFKIYFFAHTKFIYSQFWVLTNAWSIATITKIRIQKSSLIPPKFHALFLCNQATSLHLVPNKQWSILHSHRFPFPRLSYKGTQSIFWVRPLSLSVMHLRCTHAFMCINQELDLTEKKVILSLEGFIKQYY